MPQLPSELSSALFHRFDFKLGNFNIGTNVLQAVAVVFLIFLLILTIAQMRRRFVDWHLQGAMGGVAFGFLLAIIIEGLLVVGGRTVFTEVIGWKDAPKPIANALDTGREKLIGVLGVTETIPASQAFEKPTIGGLMENYQLLGSSEKETVRSIICTQ